ncbi:serine hydrolase [Patescibacteria group bacterium]|nr:serine hydrolase [Patescibacteria group bacterium]
MKRYSILASLSILGLAFTHVAVAQVEPLLIKFDAPTIIKGYTAEFNRQAHPSWGDFRLAIVPDLVNEEINLNLKKFDGSYLPTPSGKRLVSDYYIYDILRKDQANKDPLILNRPFIVAIKFDFKNYYRKQIYFWNKPSQTWNPLPSSADYDNGYIRAYSHLPFSRIAVFEDTGGVEGRATWYRSSRYRYGVASNDFPMGTKLRVRNVDNGKMVDVEVVSTGPFVPFSERRVIDLTLPAFEQIEEKWKGIARVQVWSLEGEGTVLGLFTDTPSDGIVTVPSLSEPTINASAVISINEKTGEIIYSKNYDSVRSIASLTKLMTAVIFLETDTPWDQVITYQTEDDAVGSRLHISSGETLTVKDLYYTMLVGSANNASNALARSTGLSREEFVQRMNDKAKSWGLANTHFVDVHGLDPANVSTPYEIALMARNAFKDFRILQGTTTWSYGFRTINTDIGHTIDNTAKGMRDSSLVITGMKTGYLDEAGYCFILKASTTRDGGDVITVVLGADSLNQRYAETNDLMNYSLNGL